jgi:RNA polymerase sigma factor (TIGR02999 family)
MTGTTPPPASEITQLLSRWQNGEQPARDRLIALLYDELRRAAQRQLRGGAMISLRPTELVHEAYLKLDGAAHLTLRSRAHFMAVAAQVMRQIAVDHYRRKSASKRDGGLRVTLHDGLGDEREASIDMQALHDALQRLARIHPDKARIVEMHYFAGMSSTEIAEVLGCAPITVKRGWQSARAWLHAQLEAVP